MKYSTSLIFFAAAVASVNAVATNARDACKHLHRNGSDCKYMTQQNGKEEVFVGVCLPDPTQKNIIGQSKDTCQPTTSAAPSAAGAPGAAPSAGVPGSTGASGSTGAGGSTDSSSSGSGMAGSADSSSAGAAGSSTGSMRRRGMMKRRLDSMDFDELD